MTAILIATIGTRDLMFQISTGDWYNIGEFKERIQVIDDLGLDKEITHRDLTKYLSDRLEQYLDRIKPVIIGKLLAEQAAQIDRLYLIGTNQSPTVIERSKDTIHSCTLLAAWIEQNLNISTTILPLGHEGTDPSNFEAMFDWWRRTWREDIQPAADREIWLGLKGGVGQTSEAGRISGLSLYGDRIKFFEFRQNERNNQAGNPSDYTGPFIGTNYLWDRTQQQVLRSIDRFDYAGAKELLAPYFETKNLSVVTNLLEAGIAWNRGEFHLFSAQINSADPIDHLQLAQEATQSQSQTWWWMAYEQAYLAVVRLEQNNVAEAMLHSFRALEGGLLEWAKANLGDNFQDRGKESPIVLKSILESHSSKKLRVEFKNEKIDGDEIKPHVLWMSKDVQRCILKVSLPAAVKGEFEYFWSDDCRNKRNKLSHRLGGISEAELLNAWGEDLQDRSQWQSRILACLNILTGQSFSSLDQASLFAKMHDRIKRSIEQS